ncbi:hypothetical protein Bca52824_023459 [Brassica carinata]|uniref:Uncharacterized protein n=1 Tax=Brassica carinata TaxID=52824 RepID=A0A8X8AUF7_BRACI|nr:hypothetical protein Bca52824_023459 [Brassica carinata]
MKFRNQPNDARANFSGDVGEPSTPTINHNGPRTGDIKALASSSYSTMRTNQDEAIKRSDIEASSKSSRITLVTLLVSH